MPEPGAAPSPVAPGPNRAVSWILVIAAVACLFFMLRFVVAHPMGTLDFVNLYAAGTIIRRGMPARLYDFPLQQELQWRLNPHGQFLPFIHPPFEAWWMAQFAYLPFAWAYLAWAAFNLALLGLIFYLFRFVRAGLDENSRLMWLFVCLPPVAGTVVLGQDSLLVGLAFLLVYLALARRREFRAGLALGLGLCRFEIVLPFAFIFLLRRRWKVLAGFALAVFLAVIASAGVVGWSGLGTYAAAIWRFGQTTRPAASLGLKQYYVVMPSLHGFLTMLLGETFLANDLFLITLAGSLLLTGWAAFRFDRVSRPEEPAFDLEFSMSVLAALLASYYLFVHELTPLLVAAFLILGYESAARPRAPFRDRPGAQLLLLTALVPIVGSMLRFRNFSVLFVVLLGLVAWLAQELAALRKSPASR